MMTSDKVRLIRLTLMMLFGILLVAADLPWFWIIGFIFFASILSFVSVVEGELKAEETGTIRSFLYD
jgi:hypothetical protein